MRAVPLIRSMVAMTAVAGVFLCAPQTAVAGMTAEEMFELLKSKYPPPVMPVEVVFETTTSRSRIDVDQTTFREIVDWQRAQWQKMYDDTLAEMPDVESELAPLRWRIEHTEEEVAKEFGESQSTSWTRYASDGLRWRCDIAKDGPFGSAGYEFDRAYAQTEIFDGATSWGFFRVKDDLKEIDPDARSLAQITSSGGNVPTARRYEWLRSPAPLTFALSDARPVELMAREGPQGSHLWDLVMEYPNSPGATCTVSIDREKDFAATRVVSSDGRFEWTWSMSDWQMRRGRWMPGVVETNMRAGSYMADEFVRATGHDSLPYRENSARIEVTYLETDPVIPEEAFVPRFPVNTLVHDYRTAREVFGLDSEMSIEYMTDSEVVGVEAINALAWRNFARYSGLDLEGAEGVLDSYLYDIEAGLPTPSEPQAKTDNTEPAAPGAAAAVSGPARNASRIRALHVAAAVLGALFVIAVAVIAARLRARARAR